MQFSTTQSKKSVLTQNKPLEATEGEKHWGHRVDIAYEEGVEWGGWDRQCSGIGGGGCRVLSEELAEKVDTESDMGEKNKSVGESMT